MARKKKEAKAAVYDCPKCSRKAWKPDVVERRGKGLAKVLRYRRYRHPVRYGRREVHYERIEEEQASR